MITTFYSYKGGVGRTFLALETAAALAAAGREVVFWDLDLEAPGVARNPSLADLPVPKVGTLDLFASVLATGDFPKNWIRDALVQSPSARVLGSLSFLLPAPLDDSYPARFAAIDWATLFGTSPETDSPETKQVDPQSSIAQTTSNQPIGRTSNYDHTNAPTPDSTSTYESILADDGPRDPEPTRAGLAVLYRVIRELTDQGVEHVIIDSRTGLTELAAHCLLDVPNNVVLVTNLSEQSLVPMGDFARAITDVQYNDEREKIALHRVVTFVPSNEQLIGHSPTRRQEQLRKTRDAKLKDLRNALAGELSEISLDPSLLIDASVPTLAGSEVPANIAGIARQIDDRWRAWKADDDAEIALPSDAEVEVGAREFDRFDGREFDDFLRGAHGDSKDRVGRDNTAKGRTFEQDMGELFELLGYEVTVGYRTSDMQFDLRLTKPGDLTRGGILVECKNEKTGTSQATIRKFASKVLSAQTVDRKRYEAVFVAKKYSDNAHAAAEAEFVTLYTPASLARTLLNLERLATHHKDQWVGTRSERTYVEPLTVRSETLRESGGTGAIEEPLLGVVNNWLAEPGQPLFVLMGEFGTGKSTFSKRLSADVGVRFLRDPQHERTPILIDLRKMGTTTGSLSSMASEAYQEITGGPLRANAFRRANEEGNIVLIVDGFDEMLAYSEPGQLIHNLRDVLSVAKGNAKVLLTGRTNFFRDWPEEVRYLQERSELLTTSTANSLFDEIRGRHARIGYLVPFNDAQVDDYLLKAAPDRVEQANALLADSSVRDLAHRPFLLHLICESLPRLKPGSKVTITDLYEVYTAQWMNADSKRMRVVGPRSLEVIEEIARRLWNSPTGQMHWRTLGALVDELFGQGTTGGSGIDLQQVDSEVRTASFLVRDTAGNYRFAHRSFLEFFVARNIRTGLERNDPKALDLRRITPEVDRFLTEWPLEKELDELTSSILRNPYRPQISENALILRHRRGLPLPESAHLEGADLRDLDLNGLVATSANFDGASARNVNFTGANLERASLRSSDLTIALFNDAKLSLAHLDRALCRGGSFRSTKLVQASVVETDFSGAKLRGADFSEAKLSGAKWANASARQTKFSFGKPLGLRIDEPLHPVLQSDHSSDLTSVAYNPDGTTIITASSDHTARIWNAATGEHLKTLTGHTDRIWSVACSPDGTTITTGCADHTAKIWNSTTGEQLKTLHGHSHGVTSVAYNPDGTTIITASSDHTARIWNAATGEHLKTLTGHTDSLASVAFSPDGTTITTGSGDHTAKIWNATTGEHLKTLKRHTGPVTAVAYSPDGNNVTTTSSDYTARIWTTKSGQLVFTLTGYSAGIRSLAYSSGDRLVVASDDGHARIWDTATGSLLRRLGETGAGWSICYSPDGSRITMSDDHTAGIWRAGSGRLLASLVGHVGGIHSVAYSPDGKTIATASWDNTARIWNANTGAPVTTLLGHTSAALAVVYSPNGKTIATGSLDCTTRIWDAETGESLATLSGHKAGVWCVAFSPDGNTIATGSDDNTARIWNLKTGELTTLLGHTDGVSSVAFSTSQKTIATGSHDRTIRIWSTETGGLQATLTGHSARVYSVAFSPDGETLASASVDNTARIWNTATGKEIVSLVSSENDWVCVTPDGLASGSPDGLRDLLRWVDQLAAFDVTDVPELINPDAIASRLALIK
jgi:WD40 repeat protein